MPVVFEDLDEDLRAAPGPRHTPRWLPAAGAVVVIGVVAALVARPDGGGPTSSPTSGSSAVVSFVPTAARGVVGTPGDAPVIVLDQYAVPGVMSVAGRAGWRLDASDGVAQTRTYQGLDLATGTYHPTVTFGVADRAPLATIEAETTRYGAAVTAGGGTGLTVVYSAFEGAFAADLTWSTAGGRYVAERLWLHAGTALFVQVSDVWAEAVTTVFDDTVRYGAITP